jgi:hypothetical protein
MTVSWKTMCKCGRELKVTAIDLDFRSDLEVEVEPCAACLEKAGKEKYEEGFRDGTVTGRAQSKSPIGAGSKGSCTYSGARKLVAEVEKRFKKDD